MEANFHAAADVLTSMARPGELVTLWFAAEHSDFVRFNRARIRQAGSVQQIYARVHLIVGKRHAEATVTLAGNGDDVRQLTTALDELRDVVASVSDDPLLAYAEGDAVTRTVHTASLPTPEHVIETVLDAAGSLDLVGFYAAGPIGRGFASSQGARHWHEVQSFSLEWSLYARTDKAVRTTYAGFVWDDAELVRRMQRARIEHSVLLRPAMKLSPGSYRAWLTPTALNELTGMLCWGGFSGRSRQTRQSCLLRMMVGEATMSPKVSLRENLADGIAPGFQSDGFVRPKHVELITKGSLGDALVSPRTAREFGIAHNGASSSESPDALEMLGGDIPGSTALERLGSGIWVSNLWYLNFSDRAACRVTGMTRFGTFWVERGEVVAPLDVMRFDDSVIKLLGERLEGLSTERELLPNTLTFRERAVDSSRLPGALLSGLTLTL
jgi:predicted Zn-dependent protease